MKPFPVSQKFHGTLLAHTIFHSHFISYALAPTLGSPGPELLGAKQVSNYNFLKIYSSPIIEGQMGHQNEKRGKESLWAYFGHQFQAVLGAKRYQITKFRKT